MSIILYSKFSKRIRDYFDHIIPYLVVNRSHFRIFVNYYLLALYLILFYVSLKQLRKAFVKNFIDFYLLIGILDTQ